MRLLFHLGCLLFGAVWTYSGDLWRHDAKCGDISLDWYVAPSHIFLMFILRAVVAGAGCAELAAAVLLQAELASVSAAPHAPADGTVIESRLDKGLGPVFVTIIRDGDYNLWQFDV